MKKSHFKTPLAKNSFYNKYAQGHADTWANLAVRLIDDVCGTMSGKTNPILSKSERDYLVNIITEMKFIPGGRYLYYAGRPMHAWNNCLAGDTRLWTDSGLRRMDSFTYGEEVSVLSPITGTFLPAKMYSHGEQVLRKITFAPLRGKSLITWTVRATRNHHWPLISGSDTYDLRVDDVVPAGSASLPRDMKGFVHGLVFADGSTKRRRNDGVHTYHFRLCGWKAEYLELIKQHLKTSDRATNDNGDPTIGIWSEIDLKALPDSSIGAAYIASFIEGWLKFDGHDGLVKQIHTIDEKAIDWFIEHAPLAGLTISGIKRVTTTPSNFGDRQPLFQVNYQKEEYFSGFKVIDIEDDVTETVWCPFEPVHNRIVLEHGIDTYQCFLLRAEEDSREEWASLSQRVFACLMLGGGIGIDYSRLRSAGSALSRTGGQASGPVPLMHAINEIGRNVMQGGSRRSAIYASLNWQHGDVGDFMTMKNWDTMQLGDACTSEGHPYTHWHAKQANFNHHAPMDMTNVSLNYDDAWLNKPERHLDPTFLLNVEQAMRTGEPGFSFNFGDQQNETLRNACTEVTSEDDSDVCNLGSINLGNIETLAEFQCVVQLAAKFLVCGTIRADLPYEKVRQVREKNRRLGLGLMGIHEWLLKRGRKYEVTDELRTWLDIYRDDSNRSADEHCDRLYLSRPVAYRAIAPTGTIGILASTTTGIEPLFAVAYKRRYLTNGTKWKYEYVVDATADHLIKSLGINPLDIESAYALSNDPERRIRFQAEIQKYVDQSISSTINLPSWGSAGNNGTKVRDFAKILAAYAPELRGFTCYPDGSRGGQPLVEVPYDEAIKHKGVVYEENDVCSITGKGGSCGV